MRIISGAFRGREIKSPNSATTHPMGSREKLALFNMISSYLSGAIVLDAYAGSGALGIEAVSRGAKKVIFIEKNAKVARVIRENLAALRIQGGVFIGDVKNFTTDQKYDLILADPPYDNFKIEEILLLTEYLKDGGILVLSHPGISPKIGGLNLTTSRKYAGATISIYQK